MPIVARALDAAHPAPTASREARCSCGARKPSSPSLAFFQARGPGSDLANKICRHCGYHDIAHHPEVMARNRSLKCTSFKRRSEGYEFDIFYCGCRGWD